MRVISIIVPVYNAEKYITRCIDSILRQTFTDFELILVDDGSTDCSGRICDEFAAYDERVKVIHQENSGVSSARNNGVKVALGEFITFVDSDDWIEKEYLDVLYKAVSKNGADAAVTSEIQFHDGELVESDKANVEEMFTGREAMILFAKSDTSRISTPWGKLVSKQIVERVPFPENRSYGEDTACVYKWYWLANRVVSVKKRMYRYYISENSLGRKPYSESRFGVFETYKEMICFFEENELFDLKQDYVDRLLLTAMIDYQTLKYSDDSEVLLNKLKKIIKNAENEYLRCSDVFYGFDKLIKYFGERECRRGCMWREELLNDLVYQIKEKSQFENPKVVMKERKMLQYLLVRYNRLWRTYTGQKAYEFMFPRLSTIYWDIMAQISKFRGRWKNE